MIPSNAFTATAQVDAFVPPVDDIYNPTTVRASGGIAIGDGSRGREVQFWTADYVAGAIVVTPALGGTGFTLTVAGVLTLSLAFDNAMRVVLGYMKDDGAYLYYYNSLTPAFETLYYATATSCRVCVDDTAEFYNSASDVIFAYVAGGNLCWRQQRDRYAVERVIGPATGKLVRVGLNRGNRLQFQLKD